TQAKQVDLFANIKVTGAGFGVEQDVTQAIGDKSPVGAITGLHWAYTLDNKENKDFTTAYKSKYGRLADVFAMQGYDTARVIIELMDVLNLAHGSFYMLGAYVGLTVLGVTGNFWLALIAAPVALCVIGALIEVVFFRRIYREGHLMQVLLTFGFTLVFVDLIRWRFGPQTHSLPTPPGLEGAVHILGVTFASYKLFVILFASMVALVLLLAWRRSRVGAILRAGVADREMLGLLGIDLKRVFTATFAFGSALAGLAGVVVGPYLGVYPGMDESILVLVLVVVVVGGAGSLEGAILGSL